MLKCQSPIDTAKSFPTFPQSLETQKHPDVLQQKMCGQKPDCEEQQGESLLQPDLHCSCPESLCHRRGTDPHPALMWALTSNNHITLCGVARCTHLPQNKGHFSSDHHIRSKGKPTPKRFDLGYNPCSFSKVRTQKSRTEREPSLD